MKENFLDIDYDLSQNLLDHNSHIEHYFFDRNLQKIVPLSCHSLILSVAYVYKDSEIVEAIKNTKDVLEDPENLTDRDIIEMKKLESKAMMKYDEYCISKSVDKDKLIPNKLEIHNVLMQIFDFLIKGVMYGPIHVNIYLRNLAFTRQGTINLKKTILRILMEPFLPLIPKFEVACHYFVNNRTIKSLYHTDKSVAEEKYFTSNPKFITDYSLYYWAWQIHGTRKLVTEPSIFYSQSGSIWSRADLPNDIAMLSIFQKAVEDNNESAVQHLWINHISKMPNTDDKLSDALKMSYSSPYKINICLYLLFQIQNNDLISLFKEVTYEILKHVLKSNKWYFLFILIEDKLRSFLSSEAIVELLYNILECHCCDYLRRATYFKEIFLVYLSYIPKSAKAVVRANREKLEKALIQVCTTGDFPIDFFLFVIFRRKEDNHYEELKSFFCSIYGIRFFTNLIKKGKFGLVENILKYNIKPSDNQEVKSFMNIQYIYPICKEFIKSHQFERLFSFIEWWSCSLSTDQAQSYKNEIIEINKIKLQEAFFNYESISSLESLDDFKVFLIWYFGLKEFTSKLNEERNSV